MFQLGLLRVLTNLFVGLGSQDATGLYSGRSQGRQPSRAGPAGEHIPHHRRGHQLDKHARRLIHDAGGEGALKDVSDYGDVLLQISNDILLSVQERENDFDCPGEATALSERFHAKLGDGVPEFIKETFQTVSEHENSCKALFSALSRWHKTMRKAAPAIGELVAENVALKEDFARRDSEWREFCETLTGIKI